MLLDPGLNVISSPYFSLDQLIVGCWPVRSLRELVDALTTDASEPPAHFGRPHQISGHVTTLQATTVASVHPIDGLLHAARLDAAAQHLTPPNAAVADPLAPSDLERNQVRLDRRESLGRGFASRPPH